MTLHSPLSAGEREICKLHSLYLQVNSRIMLQVDKQEAFQLPHIHIYKAGDRLTLEPNEYLVSLIEVIPMC
jgi:hypothetical protein